MGFPVPLSEWLEGGAREFVEDVLSSDAARGRELIDNRKVLEGMARRGALRPQALGPALARALAARLPRPRARVPEDADQPGPVGGAGKGLGTAPAGLAGRPSRVSWLRRRPDLVLACALLLGVVGFHAATLTSAPPVFGDEAWVGSKLWSLVHGDGFRSPMAADYEIYDVGTDYWTARIGSLPQVIGALIGPETFGFQRLVSLLTSLVALAVFWIGLRRVHGATAATFGAAALAATWGFFTASHWIRFDPMGLLVAAAVLAILLSGPPGNRACLGIGLMLGLASDWAYPVMAVVPGVALLAAWEPGERRRRLGALAAGIGIGLVVFYGLHVLPDPDAAREQYDTHYKPSYGDGSPLVNVFRDGSLQPLLDESDRYELLLPSPFRPSIITLLLGLVGALAALLVTRGVGGRALRLAGFGAIAAGVAALLIHHLGDFYIHNPGFLDAIRFAIFALMAAGVGALGWLLWRDRPDYPLRAVAAILLLSQLIGLGLIQDFELGTSTDWGLVYAVAALIAAAELLAPQRGRLAVAAVMTAVTIGGASYMIESESEAVPSAALSEEVSEIAREVVPPDKTVIGEHVYWWLFGTSATAPTPRSGSSSTSTRSTTSGGRSTRSTPTTSCSTTSGSPGIRPQTCRTPPSTSGRTRRRTTREKRELLKLLRSEYRPVRRLEFEGQRLVFWERADLSGETAASPGA